MRPSYGINCKSKPLCNSKAIIIINLYYCKCFCSACILFVSSVLPVLVLEERQYISNQKLHLQLSIPLMCFLMIPLHVCVCTTWIITTYCSLCRHHVWSHIVCVCCVKSLLSMNLLDPLYCCHAPLLHSPADVRQGRLVVPAVYLLPFRGFTWEATAQINSLNSHCSVGISLSLPSPLACSFSFCLLLHLSLSLSNLSLHIFLFVLCLSFFLLELIVAL